MIEQQAAPMADAEERRARLNPLALPAETDGLFRMMVAGSFLLAMYTVFLYIIFGTLLGIPWFFADVPWNTWAFERTNEIVADRWILALADAEVRILATDLFRLNLGAFVSSLPRVMLVSFFGSLLTFVSVVLYRTHFRRVIRRDRLRPLGSFPRADHAIRVRSLIDSIARSAALGSTPEIVIRTRHKGDAQVFGHGGRYVLRVDAAPLGRTVDELGDLLRRGQSDSFRARILHEFGHIANRDVERSYYSRSIWRVFLALILAPIITIIVGFNTFETVRALQAPSLEPPTWVVAISSLLIGLCILIAQTLALVLVMLAIWRALLRTREIYADWRAVLWGAEGPLKALLAHEDADASLAPDEASTATNSNVVGRAARGLVGWARRQWHSLWQFHPRRAARLNYLNNPDQLFKISRDVPFLTGVLFSFTMIGVPLLIIYAGLPLFNLSEVFSWGLARLAIELPAPLNRLALNSVLLVIRVGFQLTFLAFALGLTAYLVVGSLGRQVQRDALGDLLPERRERWGYASLVQPALLLAAGVELGLLIIPTSLLAVRDQLSLVLIPLWFSAFVLLSWFWLVYVRLLTRLVLGSHNGTTLPVWKRRLVTGCSLFALWALYLPILLARLSIVLMTAFPQMQARMAGTPFADAHYFALTFGFSIVVLLMLGSLLFFLWAALTFGLASLLLSLRQARCPCCGEAVREWIAVGRRCPACYQLLGMWLFVQPEHKR
jgi:hypothetical protein